MNLTIRPNFYTYKPAVKKNFKQKENIEKLYRTDKEVKYENNAIKTLAGALVLVAGTGMGLNAYQDKMLAQNYEDQKAEVELFQKQIDMLENKIENVKSEDSKDDLEKIQLLFMKKASQMQKKINLEARMKLYGSKSDEILIDNDKNIKELNEHNETCENKYSLRSVVKFLVKEMFLPVVILNNDEEKIQFLETIKETYEKASKNELTPLQTADLMENALNEKFEMKELPDDEYAEYFSKFAEFLKEAESLYSTNADEYMEHIFEKQGRKTKDHTPHNM